MLTHWPSCLLYTSDAADDLLCVDLGGRRIIKKKIDFLNSVYSLEGQCVSMQNFVEIGGTIAEI